MPTDSQVTAWLKGDSLSALAVTPGVVWSDAQSLLAKFTSPIDLRADAVVEAARTAAFLGGPNVKERVLVRGRRRDLMFKCVELSYSKLGYIPGTTEGENVVNGDFGSLTGWTNNTATLSLSGGRGVATNNAAAQGFAYQSIPVIIGQSYRYSAEIYAGSNNGRMRLGNSAGNTAYADLQIVGTGTPAGTFTPTATPIFISIGPNSNTNAATAQFDNISIRPELKRVFVIGVAENDNGTTTLTVIRSLA